VANVQFKGASRRAFCALSSTPRARRRAALLATTALIIAADLWLGVTPGQAQNATWAGPGPDWNTGANWTGATVPTNTATFAGAAPTSITFSQPTSSIETLQFNAGAPGYTFTLGGAVQQSLTINGTGIVNNSSNAPSFVTQGGFGGGSLFFAGGATAANASITNLVGGNTEFDEQSTAGSSTITNNFGGFLQFGQSGLYPIVVDTATAGTSTINNNGGSISFNSATTAGSANITNNFGFIFFNDVATAGHAAIDNMGSISFLNNSTAGNATIVNEAGGFLLSFADQSTAGNATITTNTGSETQFSANGDGGTARFIFGGGILDVSGQTIGQVHVGSIEGNGTVRLGGNTLTIGSNNLSTTFSGVIQDAGGFGGNQGSIVKAGAGTLILSGASTYTGTTTINQGTLQLDGSITSPVTVNSGGMFSGNGTAGASGIVHLLEPSRDAPKSFGPVPPAVTINSGGTFAPGLPGQPGTSMVVNGNLAFQTGAFYLLQLNASSTTFANVNGTATLAGTVQAFFAPGGYVVPKTYDILKSTGLGGTTFQNLVITPANFKANLSYSTTDVFLTLTAALGTLGGNLNVNQQNVATTLNNFFNSGGALPPNFAAVFGLTGPALANALSQLDGEVSVDAEATAFKSMDQFLGLMLDPFVDGRTGSPTGGALGFAPDRPQTLPPDIALAYDAVLKAPPKIAFADRWTAWGAAYGGANHTNGDPAIGSTNFTAQTFGFAAGMDRHFGPDLVAGFALAGGGTHWGLAQAMGTGRSDAFQAGLYATKYFGPAYVAADIAFANHWMTTNRTAFAGDQLRANFDAQSFGGRVEAGYRYALPATWTVTPYGALQVQSFHTPRYSETDLTGGGFGLTYNAMSAYDTRSELGARFDEPTVINGMPVTLRARLAWAHDWVNNPALGAIFQVLPGTNFVVNGAAVPKNSALTTVGAELHLTPAWSFLTKFDGEFAKSSQTYAGTGTLRYTW
jgi:autotransporter-associated beta strand protein